MKLTGYCIIQRQVWPGQEIHADWDTICAPFGCWGHVVFDKVYSYGMAYIYKRVRPKS